MVVVMMTMVVEAARGRGGRGKRSAGDDDSGGEAEDEFADHSHNSMDKALNANVLSHVRWSVRHRLPFTRNVTLLTAERPTVQTKTPDRDARPGFLAEAIR